MLCASKTKKQQQQQCVAKLNTPMHSCGTLLNPMHFIVWQHIGIYLQKSDLVRMLRLVSKEVATAAV